MLHSWPGPLLQTSSSSSNLVSKPVTPGMLDRHPFATGKFGDDFTNSDQPPRAGFFGRQTLSALFMVAPTIAWSDDRQIVSTVADAALAVARAGGSLSLSSCLSAMRLYKGSRFSR